MEISPYNFLLLIVHSALAGALLGFAYDVIRISKVLIGVQYSEHKKIKLNEIVLPVINRKAYGKGNKVSKKLIFAYETLIDCAFMIACGISCVLLAFVYNSGEMRFAIFAAVISGFFVYYFTLGKLVISLSEYVAFAVRTIFIYLCEILKLPISKIHKVFVQYRNKSKIKKERKSNEKRHEHKSKKIAKRKSKTHNSRSSC